MCPQPDAPRLERSPEALRGDASLARDLDEALPGKVAFRRVVKVDRVRFAGHIYDLQTTTGWIVSEGIITSNSTVYHTNAATAYTSGRFRQARDPDIAPVFPAFELLGRTVPPSCELCRTSTGLIAACDDPVWNYYAPPLHWNCEHVLRMVDRVELRRRGLLREDGSVIRYEPSGFGSAPLHPSFSRGSLAVRMGFG